LTETKVMTSGWVWRLKRAAGVAIAAALAFGAVPTVFAQSTGEYRVGPKDLLEIKVLEAPELNGERRVSDAGTISLPLLGEVQVSGLSAGQLRDLLARDLTAKFVNRANVSIVVKEYANKPITVVGAVAQPGTLNVSGNYFLLQAISRAGGVTAGAGKKIYVLRVAENGLTDTLEVSTKDLFESADPKWNIPIVPSDFINVPPRTTVKVFCLGEVASPGEIVFDSDDRISLLAAIAKAGGLTDRASSKVRIKRRDEDGRDLEIVVNYKRILSGSELDPTLQPDDMIVVKESFF
jgi:polysaccharide export outer membrane protein